MFFLASKIFWLFFAPANFLMILLVVGVLCWRRAWGRFLCAFVAVCLVVIATVPVGKWLLIPLENHFMPQAELPAHIDGLIVLGGSTDQHITQARNMVALNDSAERLTEFVRLVRQYPEAKAVFTGGSARIFPTTQPEAETAKRFFAEAGLNTDRIIFEDQSRNTYENVIFSQEKLKPQPNEIWVLITSANHLPRAVGLFHKAGWEIIPYATNFRTDGIYDFGLRGGIDFNLLQRLHLLNKATHEWVGLIAYYLSGKTDRILPRQTYNLETTND